MASNLECFSWESFSSMDSQFFQASLTDSMYYTYWFAFSPADLEVQKELSLGKAA